MNKLVGIGIVGGVILLLLVWVGVTASGVAGEASRIHDMIEKDIAAKATVDDVKKQLAEEHYEVTGAAPELQAVGPVHSLVVYQTHLTLRVNFSPEGTANGYKLERL